MTFSNDIQVGIPEHIPDMPKMDPKISRAPKRAHVLTADEKRLAVENALRYFPAHSHNELAPEFADELETHGRIYMYRYRPHHRFMPAQSTSIPRAAVMLPPSCT